MTSVMLLLNVELRNKSDDAVLFAYFPYQHTHTPVITRIPEHVELFLLIIMPEMNSR